MHGSARALSRVFATHRVNNDSRDIDRWALACASGRRGMAAGKFGRCEQRVQLGHARMCSREASKMIVRRIE